MQELLWVLFIFPFCSCSTSYYVVRHAEKAQAATGTAMFTPNDPPLSEEGMKRAAVLKEKLEHKKISTIFSTNTVRTLATASPLSKARGITPQIYGPSPDATFINQLRLLHQNVLIVGHSNTVDDIVNGLCKMVKIKGDLPDNQYGDLFIVKKKGNKYHFKQARF